MDEETPLLRAEFNHLLRIESRPERLTSEPGAIVLCEVLERLGLMSWLEDRLLDRRNPLLITHPLMELVRTSVFLLAPGWHDQDDADALRGDSVFRLAVSDRRGVSPLKAQPMQPQGLASQTILSRPVRAPSLDANRHVLWEALVALASRRVLAMRPGHRMRYLTLDVDSFPSVVHGHQVGSEHNGHHDARICHPLIATAAELGDILDVRLRPGNAHTAD
jgi:hypothetical protein